ncbi:hypothetical protein Pmani_002285 [Petrolisthes manimaculis]|uniref:DUF1279 domain-containing protein n=1 Tax=Petrolisthes manimaculis TaxID=1843537 RepID=A0AAE1UR53_9EUCA|nr:hypothetical protein Pmani_002285 [Petrolisthes manimaculis]
MLQRATPVIFPYLCKGFERSVIQASCHSIKCRGRSLAAMIEGERGLSHVARAGNRLDAGHQRDCVQSLLAHRNFSVIPKRMSTMFHTAVSLRPQMTALPLLAYPETTVNMCHVRLYSTKPPTSESVPHDEDCNRIKAAEMGKEKETAGKEAGQMVDKNTEKKLSLVQKFKLMYKQYWYVLIPVHVVTSIVWYGSFFIAAKSGVDIVPVLEKLGAGEKILSHLQNSNAGYYAIAYAMYKIATPARYTITLGGTTISINYLKKHGYIKPVPSPEQLKEMYEDKREEFIEKKEEIVEKYQEKRDEIVDRYQERKEEIVGKYQEKKGELKERVAEKKEELREKVAEKKEELKDKLEERKEKFEQARDSLRKQR